MVSHDENCCLMVESSPPRFGNWLSLDPPGLLGYAVPPSGILKLPSYRTPLISVVMLAVGALFVAGFVSRGLASAAATSIAADDGISTLEGPALLEYAMTCNDPSGFEVRKHVGSAVLCEPLEKDNRGGVTSHSRCQLDPQHEVMGPQEYL
ncbi:hypothetical protein AURANDRAFT_67366 [Aureococcus anophagefferens]|uniref:Uncharacterized protein n=1 Tax=Aureococcus anophagefferens TaxID=44056 RepID=F0YKW9_AURAN|nr:hypothetical protein AURANDRAFT_67366 [Aureococcus anophagefferens]EGB04248.1 hypothetical protein AURANDRAFT_67366 [Aureococcus anophagefferens]|eukprot:XP_009041099.1 hypothetical protein AURANDRAFT_67366 [Aureococcus anophagefferens]